MEKKNFLKELFSRIFKEETPDFWKKIRAFAITIVAVAGAIIGFDQVGIPMPDQLVTICGYVIAGGTVLGLSATTTSTGKIKTDVPPQV